jgi:hypothetical protein
MLPRRNVLAIEPDARNGVLSLRREHSVDRRLRDTFTELNVEPLEIGSLAGVKTMISTRRLDRCGSSRFDRRSTT